MASNSTSSLSSAVLRPMLADAFGPRQPASSSGDAQFADDTNKIDDTDEDEEEEEEDEEEEDDEDDEDEDDDDDDMDNIRKIDLGPRYLRGSRVVQRRAVPPQPPPRPSWASSDTQYEVVMILQTVLPITLFMLGQHFGRSCSLQCPSFRLFIMMQISSDAGFFFLLFGQFAVVERFMNQVLHIQLLEMK